MVATRVGIELESFEYHRASETYRSQYDDETTSASMAVVASLSEAMEVEPTELEPLQESIDTDALDELVRFRNATSGDTLVTLFVEAHTITVSNGSIEVSTPERDRTDGLDRVSPT